MWVANKDAVFVSFFYLNSLSVYSNTVRYSFPPVICIGLQTQDNALWTI